MASIFLSHNEADKPFARRLANDLIRFGVRVWIDEAEIKIGDSLIEKIRQGIDSVEYVAVILSENSIKSEWVKKEVDIAMNQEIEGKRVKVLPLLVEDCELPWFLKGKLYADFRKTETYRTEFAKLAERLGVYKRPKLDSLEVNHDEIWENENIFFSKNTLLKYVTWDYANDFAGELNIRGLDGWSLPTVLELQFLRSRRHELCISEKYCYWSSERKGSNDAFYIHFDDGHVGNAPKSFSHGLCAVFLKPKRMKYGITSLADKRPSDLEMVEILVLEELRNKPDVLWTRTNIENSIKFNHPENEPYFDGIQVAIESMIRKGYLQIDENKSVSVTLRAIEFYRKFPNRYTNNLLNR